MSATKTAPVGNCIYCDADGPGTKLTDEHVIPYALNGPFILSKASCRACAEITSTIERFVLREMYLDARVHLRMRTRRPKNRPKTLPLHITSADSSKETTHHTPDKHPFVLRMPLLVPPPILSGQTGGDWVGHESPCFWTFVGANDPKQIPAAENWAVNFTYATTQFCLFLAKIAHCCAVWRFGYGNFIPLLPDLILAKSNNVCDYVGKIVDPIEIDRDTSFHARVENRGDFVMTYLCPFAHLGAPAYQVVTGLPAAISVLDSAFR